MLAYRQAVVRINETHLFTFLSFTRARMFADDQLILIVTRLHVRVSAAYRFAFISFIIE
jgi:hypothetical protein